MLVVTGHAPATPLEQMEKIPVEVPRRLSVETATASDATKNHLDENHPLDAARRPCSRVKRSACILARVVVEG